MTDEEMAKEIRKKALELSDILEKAWIQRKIMAFLQKEDGGGEGRTARIHVTEIRKRFI